MRIQSLRVATEEVMTSHVHFVGSIGLDSTDAIFAAVGQTVKPFLKRCPDGEVAGRRLWISYQWPVLRARVRTHELVRSILEIHAKAAEAFPG